MDSPATVDTNAYFSESCFLISQIIGDPAQKARVTGLVGKDAQCIADFLSVLLNENDALESCEGKLLFKLLRRLAGSTQVLPQCYKLQGIQCDFSRGRGGGSTDIFEGEYRNKKICVKAIRIFRETENVQVLKAYAKDIILWAHLSHMNVLPFYGVYLSESQRICMVSPWVEMGDLSAYLQSFPQIPRMPLVSDIVAGLLYLHQSGVVHGNLKAKNVLISDYGRALITDFGISRIATTIKLDSTRGLDGTMRWTAPELLTKDSVSPTQESDIWSFGCVCYEIFTRKVPFHEYATDYHLIPVLLERTEIPRRPTGDDQLDSISDEIWDLMRRCWDYTPHNRPTCEDIHQSMFDFTRAQSLQHPQEPIPEIIPWESVRRNPSVVIDYEHVHDILSHIRHEALFQDNTGLQQRKRRQLPSGVPGVSSALASISLDDNLHLFGGMNFDVNLGRISSQSTIPLDDCDITPVSPEDNLPVPLSLPLHAGSRKGVGTNDDMTSRDGKLEGLNGFFEQYTSSSLHRPGPVAEGPGQSSSMRSSSVTLSPGLERRVASMPDLRTPLKVSGSSKTAVLARKAPTSVNLTPSVRRGFVPDRYNSSAPRATVGEKVVVEPHVESNMPNDRRHKGYTRPNSLLMDESGSSTYGSVLSSPTGTLGPPASSTSTRGSSSSREASVSLDHDDRADARGLGDSGRVWGLKSALKRSASTTAGQPNAKRAAFVVSNPASAGDVDSGQMED